MKIRSWIRYFSQEERLKGIAMAFLVLSVFFAPEDNPYSLGWIDYLPAASYALLFLGIGLRHMFNFLSLYKSWRNPTRVILFAGGFAAALTLLFCGASLLFVFCLYVSFQIYWHFLEQDRKKDAAAFGPEIEAAQEKDRQGVGNTANSGKKMTT